MRVRLLGPVDGGRRHRTAGAGIDIYHCTSTSSTTNTAQTFYVQPHPVP
jgi:hypothetical protein